MSFPPPSPGGCATNDLKAHFSNFRLSGHSAEGHFLKIDGFAAAANKKEPNPRLEGQAACILDNFLNDCVCSFRNRPAYQAVIWFQQHLRCNAR